MVLLGGLLEENHFAAGVEETRFIYDASVMDCLKQACFGTCITKMQTDRDLLASLVACAPAQYPVLVIAPQPLVFCVAPKADHLLRMCRRYGLDV